MPKKEKDDYPRFFRGAQISKSEAKKIRLGLLFGMIGVLIAIFTPVGRVKFLAYGVMIFFSIMGYYLGIKLFNKE